MKLYEDLALNSWKSYCHDQSLSFARYCYPGVISLDCLVAMSTFYTLVLLLDDLFFDNPDKNLMEPYGIDHSALLSP